MLVISNCTMEAEKPNRTWNITEGTPLNAFKICLNTCVITSFGAITRLARSSFVARGRSLFSGSFDFATSLQWIRRVLPILWVDFLCLFGGAVTTWRDRNWLSAVRSSSYSDRSRDSFAMILRLSNLGIKIWLQSQAWCEIAWTCDNMW